MSEEILDQAMKSIAEAKAQIIEHKTVSEEKVNERVVNKMIELMDKMKLNDERYYEPMTIKKIMAEYQIGYNKVWQMFKDKKLPVQRYCKPMWVVRGEFEKYISVSHDELCNTLKRSE